MQGHKDATAPDSEPAKAKMVSEEGGGKAVGEKSKTRVNLSSNAMAGTIAGFTSSSLTHPLDVVKTRFQVQPRPLHFPLPALARLSKARASAVSIILCSRAVARCQHLLGWRTLTRNTRCLRLSPSTHAHCRCKTVYAPTYPSTEARLM